MLLRHARRAALAAACVLLFTAGGAHSLQAELTWKQDTVDITTKPGENVVEARFLFVNGGKTAVDIQEIGVSCGCTTAELAQRHYEPGQGGEIVTRYTIGDHSGYQRKSIVVAASDQAEPTVLTIAVQITDGVKIAPDRLVWTQGEPPAAKTIRVTVAPDADGLADLAVQPSNASVAVEMKPLAGGKEYEVTVTPATTEHAVFATLFFHYRLGIEKILRAYATVEPIPRVIVPPVRARVVAPVKEPSPEVTPTSRPTS